MTIAPVKNESNLVPNISLYTNQNDVATDAEFSQTLAIADTADNRRQPTDDPKPNTTEPKDRDSNTVTDRNDDIEPVDNKSNDDDQSVEAIESTQESDSRDDKKHDNSQDKSDSQSTDAAEQSASDSETQQAGDLEQPDEDSQLLAALEAQIDPNALAAMLLNVQASSESQQTQTTATSQAGAVTANTTVVNTNAQTTQQSLDSQISANLQFAGPQSADITNMTQTNGDTTGQDASSQNQNGNQAAQSTDATLNEATANTQSTQTSTTTTSTTNAPIIESVLAASPIATATTAVAAENAQQATAAANVLQDIQNADENVARVMRGAQGVINQKGGSITLRLHPPEMGVVKIEMSVENNNVRAQFQAESESVRNLLTHRIASLQRTLENQGLNVERITITSTQQTQNDLLQDQSSDAFDEDGRSKGFFNQQPGQDDNPEDNNPDSQQQTTRFEQQLNAIA